MYTLLIVENDKEVTNLLKLYLAQEGCHFDVQHRATLKDALEVANSVNLILLDLNLPDSKGMDTFNQIHEVARDIPIVIITSIEDINLAAEAYNNGAVDFISKKGLSSRGLCASLELAIERNKSKVA